MLGEARLAPLYDLVTASIYLPKDSLALTLKGTTQWPDSKVLRRLGETRMTGTPAKIRTILERISDAISQKEAVAIYPGAVALVNFQDVKPGMKVVRVDGHMPGEAGYPFN